MDRSRHDPPSSSPAGGARLRRLFRRWRQRAPKLAVDPVTGLPGQAVLLPGLREAIATAMRKDGHFALVVLDVDRLREINLVLGYAAGDQLLARIARRLEDFGTARLFRASGDRFAMILEAPDSTTLAARLEPALTHVLRLGDSVLEVGLSAGIALFPAHAGEPDGLLRAAELALDEAKARGGRRAVMFEVGFELALRRRKLIEGALRRAIETRGFTLHFQPQFEIASGAVVGVEALLRWRPREGEEIGPDEFVPIAETTGLIWPLGRWLFEEACRTAVRIRREAAPLPVSINVSPAQLRQPDMAETLKRILERHGLPPTALELEVTEGLFVDPAQTAIRRNLEALRRLGVRFALDDFGSGYSSLAYLKRLPAWRIKIDRSFVRGLGEAPEDEAILEAIVGLGRVFGKRILAEGVETERQRRVLAAHGCDEMQGFLLARPMDSERLLAFLQRSPTVAAAGSLDIPRGRHH